VLSYESKQARRVRPEEASVARQWLSKYIPATMNTHATTEELLDVLFYMWFVSCQGK
jgi:primase-polymerase (primpol)-like protein